MPFLDEFELELLDEFELELLEEFELELLEEFELELLDVFELELLEELKLELLDEFELELPADAGGVPMADSTALTIASGGEPENGAELSVAAAAARSPQAPSPAVYVFQCLARLAGMPGVSICLPRFSWVGGQRSEPSRRP